MTTTTASSDPTATAAPLELLYPDLEHELTTTRRVLERVPDGKADWRPHARSTTLGDLATHIAELPGFATIILTTDELDWAKNPYRPTPPRDTAATVAAFDEKAAEMRAAIAGAGWAELQRRWVMRAGDKVFVDGLKGPLLRTFCINHIGHHRSQLGVYLRLLDVPVPSSYGPTADEQF